MSKFRVGDVCVGKSLVLQPQYNGVECIIIGFNPMKSGFVQISRKPYGPEPRFHVIWADGEKSWQRAETLKLKRPPSWDKWIYDTSGLSTPKSVEPA